MDSIREHASKQETQLAQLEKDLEINTALTERFRLKHGKLQAPSRWRVAASSPQDIFCYATGAVSACGEYVSMGEGKIVDKFEVRITVSL